MMPQSLPILGHVADWEGLRRSEEHTSELQSQSNLVCRLLLEKKKLIIHILSLIIVTLTDKSLLRSALSALSFSRHSFLQFFSDQRTLRAVIGVLLMSSHVHTY